MVDLPQLFWQNHGAHDSLSQILEVHQIFGTNMTRDSTVPSWLAPSGFCWCHRFSETEKDVENQGFPRENDRQMVKTCDSDRHGMDDRTTHIILLGYVCWVYTHLSISIYIYPVYVCIYINTIYIMYIPCIHIYIICIPLLLNWPWHICFSGTRACMRGAFGVKAAFLSLRPYEIQPLLRSLSKVSFIGSWWFLDIVSYRR